MGGLMRGRHCDAFTHAISEARRLASRVLFLRERGGRRVGDLSAISLNAFFRRRKCPVEGISSPPALLGMLKMPFRSSTSNVTLFLFI